MRNSLTLLLAAMMCVPMSTTAQDWNREKYPDYRSDSSLEPEPSLLKFGQANTRKKAKAAAEAAGLPDHVNNASTKYFPPVFNQDGGSCGSASRICYMFTHEINSYRDIDSSTPENNYPSHFVWLLTNGNSGKDQFVTNVGVPTSATYGGRTYSKLFGNQNESNEDFGWMTGYDKWYSAFFNRMTKPTQVPYNLGTEEGRLAAKAWLYNHGGDTSFKSGGLIGLGVASAGNWQKIPKTPTNDAIGVTNMSYVKEWGTQVDHALTMVGYDDRIEFDLDGNGIYGEEDKDEKGAWIIANSWGPYWCNGGFIYCPYAHAGPAFKDGKLTGFWTGELYHTRKDYRPLRTIKLKMDYSRRSEMLLQAGISRDLNATKPESVISMDHFKYAGDGKNGNSNPAPEVPMLGKWADGKLHDEPMEFGYDLTDLTSGFDRNQPLKYFFIVNTRSWGLGNGHIYEASIIDYEFDSEGVEMPFDLGEAGQVEIQSAGEQTIISVVVQGAAFYAPLNLSASENVLKWDAPMNSGHTLEGYAVYKDSEKLATVAADTRSFAFTEGGIYGVSAVYENGAESERTTVATIVEKQEENQVVNLSKSGFSIPDIFNSTYNDCTIEFYIKPNSLLNYNNTFGPGWGTLFAHCNADGTYTVGWNTGGHRIDNSSAKLTRNAWTHIAIVVQGNKMTLYMGRNNVGSCTSSTFSGIGGFGDLVFNSGESSNHYNDASYDEIRIWNKARTATEIQNTFNREFYGEVMPEGLMAYYKGDVIEIDGKSYLRDCVGGHHALLANSNFVQEKPSKAAQLLRVKDSTNKLSINEPTEPVCAGIPVTLSTTRGDAICTMSWKVPELGISDLHVVNPTLTFSKPGSYEVIVTGYDYENPPREISDTCTITVLEAPALDAHFTSTATEVPCGDRVSFHISNPVQGYAYSWSMPGAEIESANTLSAAAVYRNSGVYTVKLSVTSPAGNTVTEEQQITVTKVAPVADFSVSEGVVMKGEKVRLKSLSKYNPDELQWKLSSAVQNYIVNNAERYDFTAETPGVYDVTLTASNEKGENSKMRERALIVVNADSHNGLTFSTGAQVTLSKPLMDETAKTLTIDWWMNPTRLTASCQGIGESTSTFMLRTDRNGKMSLHNGSSVVSSSDGYVIPGQWHHYAVTFARGAVRFLRDGVQISAASNAGTSITLPSTFSIGTLSAEMLGTIDEFRIWGSSLTKSAVQDVCNQPMDDPEAYVTGEQKSQNLLLYYQFNQSGGDVIDATSNGNTGLRIGFGPDGDAWGLSKGVFCLNFDSKQDDVIIDGIEDIVSESVTAKPANGKCYDLSGRQLDSSRLKPGLYIINGRKVLVR